MLIIRLAGGLGNQMQQYAMYRKLTSLGREVRLDAAWFEEDTQRGVEAKRRLELSDFIDLPMTFCTDAERAKFLDRGLLQKVRGKLFPASDTIWREQEMYHPELFGMEDRYLEGYFLCNKYYEDIWLELQAAFCFPAHTDAQCQERNTDLMQKMLAGDSVSIHIRRGDYLTPENAALFGGITTDAYYEAAIRYFTERLSNPHFYLFTNDVPYAKAQYPDESRFTVVDYNTGSNSMLDIQLMSCCKGNICANSTFSFWGGRLNTRPDHTVIRPYRMRNNQTYDEKKMTDYWKGWILLDEEGKVRCHRY